MSLLSLATPVTYLKGVGPRRAEALRRLHVLTAGDLLYHLPHRYEDASTVTPIASLEPGMQATVIGTVISKGIIPTRKGLRIFQAVVRDDSGMIEVSWPGQPYLDRTIAKDDVLLLSGPVRFFHGRQLQPREFVNLGNSEEGTSGGRVLSVYPATEGLSFKIIRSLIDAHLDALLPSSSICRATCCDARVFRRSPTPCARCIARRRSRRRCTVVLDWRTRSSCSCRSCMRAPSISRASGATGS